MKERGKKSVSGRSDLKKTDKPVLVLKMGGAPGQGLQASLLTLQESSNLTSPGAFRKGGSLLTPLSSDETDFGLLISRTINRKFVLF